jgi:hypothetical protein
MTFEKWFESYAPTAPESLDDCALAAYQAGADSRDAEIHHLQMALADTEALELGTAEKCDQLREQVAMLREAFQTFIDEHEECSDADDWLAMMCSCEAYHVANEALAASEPKITKPT